MTDARAALHELAEPWSRGDRVKVAIDRAARRAGLAYWRAFDIWYGKARRIEPHETRRHPRRADQAPQRGHAQ